MWKAAWSRPACVCFFDCNLLHQPGSVRNALPHAGVVGKPMNNNYHKPLSFQSVMGPKREHTKS